MLENKPYGRVACRLQMSGADCAMLRLPTRSIEATVKRSDGLCYSARIPSHGRDNGYLKYHSRSMAAWISLMNSAYTFEVPAKRQSIFFSSPPREIYGGSGFRSTNLTLSYACAKPYLRPVQ
jgi:hypothetical protein